MYLDTCSAWRHSAKSTDHSGLFSEKKEKKRIGENAVFIVAGDACVYSTTASLFSVAPNLEALRRVPSYHNK